jgi:predicted PurR-regulated permease PerM
LPAKVIETKVRTLDRDRVLVIVLGAVTAAVIVGCIVVLAPFLPALTWALSLAIIAYPLHRAVSRRIRRRDLAAGVSVTAVAIGLVAPTVFVLYHVTNQIADGAKEFQNQVQGGAVEKMLDRIPMVRNVSRSIQNGTNIGTASENMLSGVRERMTRALKATIWSLAQILIGMFALFFFFRDCGIALGFVRSMVPLSDHETDEVLAQVADMIYATIYGNVATALVQGGLGGTMFWILGIPAPLLWGVVMAILSLVPSLGSFVIWLPAAAILGVQGHWVKAMILAGWGTFVVGSIDNVLYPILVGKKIRMHTLAVFFATVGGLLVFGAPGIVVGPVLFTLANALLDIWRRRTTHGRTAEVPT